MSKTNINNDSVIPINLIKKDNFQKENLKDRGRETKKNKQKVK